MEKGMIDLGAMALLIVGGLNWGLVGLANMNLVEMVLGSIQPLPMLAYVGVGLSAVYVAYKEFLK